MFLNVLQCPGQPRNRKVSALIGQGENPRVTPPSPDVIATFPVASSVSPVASPSSFTYYRELLESACGGFLRVPSAPLR